MDQHLIRGGVWLKLSAAARLAYVALAASCDRQGVSIWSRPKLMELSACLNPDEWGERIRELESHGLVESLPSSSPPAIRLIDLEGSGLTTGVEIRPSPTSTPPVTPTSAWPFVVHTQTTISLGNPSRGGRPADVEPRNPD
jgi:hypothetical protein